MTGGEGAALLVVGLPGPHLDGESARLLTAIEPGGVILLPRNIEDAGQLRELLAGVRRLLPRVLLYLDAEGGRVDRLRKIVGPAPSGAALAASPARLAERVGHQVGEALAAFGFDVDLAPVVDLDRGHVGNALDTRYLGRRPRPVTARARAFLRGLHKAGVGGCLKHFPGLGGAGEDTHHEGTVIALGRSELEGDLTPFRDLGALAGAIMVSHAMYPSLAGSSDRSSDGPSGARPATLSPAIAGDLLRRELGFEGLAMTDDLDMHALDRWGGLPERAAASLAAGCDLLFACQHLEAAPAVVAALDRPALAGRREEARQRLEAWRRHLATLRRQALGRHGGRPPSLAAIRRILGDIRQAASGLR